MPVDEGTPSDQPLTVVVTGCSSPKGIGFATARALDAEGHHVIATVRDHSHDAELLAGTRALAVLDLDLLDTGSIRRLVADVLERHGRLDALVNNAGYGLIGGIEQSTLAQARANFDTNYFGTIELIRAVLPAMRAQRSGHILSVSSIFVPTLCPPALGHYVGTKAALEAALQALAAEVAPFGIGVTSVQPGPVDTELSRDWARPAGDPRPSLIDDLYAWVGSQPGVVMESPTAVGDAIARIVTRRDAPIALQTCAAGTAWVARALHDPTRANEWEPVVRPG